MQVQNHPVAQNVALLGTLAVLLPIVVVAQLASTAATMPVVRWWRFFLQILVVLWENHDGHSVASCSLFGTTLIGNFQRLLFIGTSWTFFGIAKCALWNCSSTIEFSICRFVSWTWVQLCSISWSTVMTNPGWIEENPKTCIWWKSWKIQTIFSFANQASFALCVTFLYTRI